MKILLSSEPDVSGNHYAYFQCPACAELHKIKLLKEFGVHGSNGGWFFNGDVDKPTIDPSIKVVYDTTGGDPQYIKPPFFIGVNVCHSFVRNGRIEFCSDSTHSMAGQTVELPEIE
jgi:hypothetical protein